MASNDNVLATVHPTDHPDVVEYRWTQEGLRQLIGWDELREEIRQVVREELAGR